MHTHPEITDICARLEAAGIPERRLYVAAGIAPSTWTRWKSEKTAPNMQTWKRVLKAFEDIVTSEAA